MFTHADDNGEAGGSSLHGLMYVLLVLVISGLVVVYARSVGLFLRVFVRVFLDELRAHPVAKPRARAKSQAAGPA